MKQKLHNSVIRAAEYLYTNRKPIARGLIFLAGMITTFDASSLTKPRALPARRRPKK